MKCPKCQAEILASMCLLLIVTFLVSTKEKITGSLWMDVRLATDEMRQESVY